MEEDIKKTDYLIPSNEKDAEGPSTLRTRKTWYLPLICLLCGLFPAFSVWIATPQSSLIERFYQTPIPECRVSPERTKFQKDACLTSIAVPTEMRVFEWNYTLPASAHLRANEHGNHCFLYIFSTIILNASLTAYYFGRGYVLIK
jgi:hypothetical protein